ncbi:MAG TPA: hypothetical protein VF172_05700 [Nitrososphaera sp.]|jgi:hypothetical protein
MVNANTNHPVNQAADRGKAPKVANLLENLAFPATKEDIKNHTNRKSSAMHNRINDISSCLEEPERRSGIQKSIFKVEKSATLVVGDSKNRDC